MSMLKLMLKKVVDSFAHRQKILYAGVAVTLVLVFGGYLGSNILFVPSTPTPTPTSTPTLSPTPTSTPTLTPTPTPTLTPTSTPTPTPTPTPPLRPAVLEVVVYEMFDPSSILRMEVGEFLGAKSLFLLVKEETPIRVPSSLKYVLLASDETNPPKLKGTNSIIFFSSPNYWEKGLCVAEVVFPPKGELRIKAPLYVFTETTPGEIVGIVRGVLSSICECNVLINIESLEKCNLKDRP